ncbi:hypothetical protein PanWU01x14_157890 [Parasponia andersonii]|uniref:Transmembrane protein n=1 Tax=Parasponia andersonii TaxID=3476 RepID=A0A2P5CFB9_PARAD|nr:hypothetical protein PanWU01x14_157890 [Parasponia andersonii]
MAARSSTVLLWILVSIWILFEDVARPNLPSAASSLFH